MSDLIWTETRDPHGTMFILEGTGCYVEDHYATCIYGCCSIDGKRIYKNSVTTVEEAKEWVIANWALMRLIGT
jgi:hypothetical protein